MQELAEQQHQKFTTLENGGGTNEGTDVDEYEEGF